MAKGEESRISLALIYRTDSDRWARTCRKDNKMNLLTVGNMQYLRKFWSHRGVQEQNEERSINLIVDKANLLILFN